MYYHCTPLLSIKFTPAKGFIWTPSAASALLALYRLWGSDDHTSEYPSFIERWIRAPIIRTLYRTRLEWGILELYAYCGMVGSSPRPGNGRVGGGDPASAHNDQGKSTLRWSRPGRIPTTEGVETLRCRRNPPRSEGRDTFYGLFSRFSTVSS